MFRTWHCISTASQQLIYRQSLYLLTQALRLIHAISPLASLKQNSVPVTEVCVHCTRGM